MDPSLKEQSIGGDRHSTGALITDYMEVRMSEFVLAAFTGLLAHCQTVPTLS